MINDPNSAAIRYVSDEEIKAKIEAYHNDKFLNSCRQLIHETTERAERHAEISSAGIVIKLDAYSQTFIDHVVYQMNEYIQRHYC